MGSSSPILKELLDLHQQKQRRCSFSGDQAKIQKVPLYLRERSEFDKYYSPKVVSIGPIHHPKGEEYKKMSASTYLLQDKIGQQGAQQLLEDIRSKIQELRKCYTEDVIRGFNDDKLSEILFVDGCAALHVMHKVNKEESTLQAMDIIVQQDLLLLENQLPFKVLMILSSEDDSALKSFINFFLESRDIIIPSSPVIDQPPHLLDLLITLMVKEHTTIDVKQRPKKKVESPTHRNIQELVTSGIKIKKGDKKNLIGIRFRGCGLCIPPLTVDDFTAQTFMNMIAYEMCPDNSKTKYEISNYMSFLNSLIDHADDVKVMRKAGVINHLLGSNEEVAKIFNTVSNDLVIDTGIYGQVRQDIERLYKHQWGIWFVELLNNHFHTPWKIIGLIAAILGCMLTTVQLKKELGPN